MVLSRPVKQNLNVTVNELNALRDIIRGKEITIRKADKGGGIVIMDTADYSQKMGELLKSVTF